MSVMTGEPHSTLRAMADACTFCGSAAADRAFLAEAPSTRAAICNVCLAVMFRQIEMRKGLEPSPGVRNLIGAPTMWPLERRLRQVNHAYWQGRAKLRTKLREILRRPAENGPGPQSPLSAMFVQHAHPLGTF